MAQSGIVTLGLISSPAQCTELAALPCRLRAEPSSVCSSMHAPDVPQLMPSRAGLAATPPPLSKDLLTDPCAACRGRNAPLVSETEPLDVVFKLFMTSYHHMLLATDRAGTVTGLITLEDVMEEILQVGIFQDFEV